MRYEYLAVALCLGLLAAPAAAEARWYAAHVGADTCVPLDDVGDDGQRLYYGTGLMKTPADFARMIAGRGVTVTMVPHDDASVIEYHADMPNGWSGGFLFFNNLDECRFVMSGVEK